MGLPTRLESSRLLLVEGKDDVEFINGLKGYLDLDNRSIQVISYDGKDNVRAGLRTVSQLPRFRRVNVLGIVRDGHNNPKGAFIGARDALGEFFTTPPAHPLHFSESAFIKSPHSGQAVYTGIAILPGHGKSGELEDLLLDAIDDAETMACVDEFVRCLEGNGIELQKPSKTKLQAFLSSRERAEEGLWKALRKDHIPADSDSFAEIRDFLSAMAKLGADS